jgi:hypothetical protein
MQPLAGILRMTPELAQIFALFRLPCNTGARCGRRPTPVGTDPCVENAFINRGRRNLCRDRPVEVKNMAERRRSTRQKSFLRGCVYFNKRRDAVDCLIRDISDEGARIIFSDTMSVPDVVERTAPIKMLARSGPFS